MQNYIIISLIVMVLMCGCVSERVETVTIDKAHADLLAFWDKTESLTELFRVMGSYGFHYYNELNDVNYYLDTAPTPEVTQKRAWANCNGYSRYVTAYIKYKRNCDSYKTILMLQRGFAGVVFKWHYINVITSGNIIFMQSNNELSTLDNIEQAQNYWISQGYQTFQVIEEWHK